MAWPAFAPATGRVHDAGCTDLIRLVSKFAANCSKLMSGLAATLCSADSRSSANSDSDLSREAMPVAVSPLRGTSRAFAWTAKCQVNTFCEGFRFNQGPPQRSADTTRSSRLKPQRGYGEDSDSAATTIRICHATTKLSLRPDNLKKERHRTQLSGKAALQLHSETVRWQWKS